MKTYGKIGFNSSKMNHEEMKNTKAGFDYSSYQCKFTGQPELGNFQCTSSATNICFKDGTPYGAVGYCSAEGKYDENVLYVICSCM